MNTEYKEDTGRKPSVLDDIQSGLKGEIAAMNAIIARYLHTGHELVNSILDNYLLTKGKQIRPLLVMLSARMFGEVNDAVLHAAASLEMLHNATLIHDDVVDETSLRRGHPTLNAIWGNHIAVLAGDIFVSKALAAVTHTENIAIMKTLSALGTELSLGEMDQLFNARGHNLDEESYFSMIQRKTASLFMGCVRIGAEALDVAPTEFEPLEKYARLLGLAFQIRDDIFDYFPSEETGKPSGNDLIEGKVTLPLIHALQVAPEEEVRKMKALLEGDEVLSADDVATLQDFARRHGGIEYAVEVMRRLQKEGETLMAAYPPSESKHSFLEIFEFIIRRTH